MNEEQVVPTPIQSCDRMVEILNAKRLVTIEITHIDWGRVRFLRKIQIYVAVLIGLVKIKFVETYE